MIQPFKTGPVPERDGPVILQVTGSRKWADRAVITNSLLTGIAACSPIGATLRTHPVREMVLRHGKAPGLDSLAGAQAEKMGMHVEKYPADWAAPCIEGCEAGHRRFRGDGSSWCPAAGLRRNDFMVKLLPPASLVLAYIIGESRGTRDCASRAQLAGLPVWFYELPT